VKSTKGRKSTTPNLDEIQYFTIAKQGCKGCFYKSGRKRRGKKKMELGKGKELRKYKSRGEFENRQ